MKRIIALVLVFCLIPGLFACSAKKDPQEEGSSPEPTADNTAEAPTPTQVQTEEPTAAPTEDPTEAEALRLAALHGLKEEELRAEYGLFIRFSEAVEANPGLGEYRDFVYRIFPVIADANDYLYEEHFFPLLSNLTIDVAPLPDSENGEYQEVGNSILLSEEMMRNQPYRQPVVLFHELMHFVDFNVNGYADYAYILDGRHLHQYEVNLLSHEDMERATLCGNSDIIKEGGAELYTAKYLCGAPSAYYKGVTFLTGIEYIMGEDFMNELFFRWDSGAVLEDLYIEIGYSHEEYWQAAIALAALSNCWMSPYDPVSPEDLLIDLYEYKLGDGWREDEGFLYILKSISDIALDDWKLSKHADFLKTIEFRTWDQYNAFSDALLENVPENPDFATLPPIPFMRGGKLLLGDIATATNPQTGESFNCAANFDFDFESGALASYELIDLEAFSAECFPGTR